MTIDDIKNILEMVREHELVEFELEQEGVRLRVRKQAWPAEGGAAPAGAVSLASVRPPAPASPDGPPPAGGVTTAAVAPDLDETVDLAVVKAPIVGTYYAASAPGAPPFVEEGTTVKKGQVLCIIEAMKLMNEIESEYDGEVAKIYVENGQPVQYGERLFAIRPR
jgi:acetyl-CoA carboxylase biotin carboxyl carrier protein